MILDPGEPIFQRVETSYSSPFPSLDSEMDAKFKALTTTQHWGPIIATERAAEAFAQALSLCNFAKATQVGDLLNSWLPKVAWMKSGKTGQVPMGLFASPVFNMAGVDASVPEQLAEALREGMVQVGLSVAMTTLAAIPVYGWIASAVVFVANALYKLISAKLSEAEKRLLLPWSEYSRDSDEDYINLVRDKCFAGVDWTDLYLPIFREAPWAYAPAPGKGFVFMPVENGEPAFNDDGFGCLPGTFRVVAQAQQTYSGKNKQDLPPGLRARVWTGTFEEVPWSSPTTNVGSFKPALAQLGGATWQQVLTPGNPDMYKVRVGALRSAWSGFFGNLFETAAGLVSAATASIARPETRTSMRATQCVELYLAYRHAGAKDWLMGVPPGWRPGHFWHPDFFKVGPVRPEHRTQCFMVEQDLPHGKDAQGRPILDYPYGTTPREYNSNYNARVEKAGLNALGNGGARPVSVIKAGGKAPKGYRCVAWPTPEMANASWASPYDVFTKPQLKVLEERQALCLRKTLVCAYVRPDDVSKKLPAYAAFVGPAGAKLRDECRAVREKLLTSPARFAVDLADVDSIDPPFAAKLRAAGVTNSFAQKAMATTVVGVVDDDTPLPPAIPPGGGYPFGGSFGGEAPRRGGGAAAVAGGGLALWALSRWLGAR